MPAQIDTMAFSGSTPWHGLGNTISDPSNIDTTKTEAGMTWEAKKAEVEYTDDDHNSWYIPDKVVLYRSDSKEHLGIVGNSYKIVQPGEVLEFFRSVTDLGQFEIETAGALLGGRKIWALAKSTMEGSLSVDSSDMLKPYLLLATSLDGTMSTSASFTTIRVVCNNTLQMALRNSDSSLIKVSHRGTFDEKAVKQQLGLVDDSFNDFLDRADSYAKREVSQKETEDFFGTLVHGDKFKQMEEKERITALDTRVMRTVQDTHKSFPGQNLKSAEHTVWGLINGVTAFLDHTKNTRTVDTRLDNSWFGAGQTMKQRAMDLADKLIAE